MARKKPTPRVPGPALEPRTREAFLGVIRVCLRAGDYFEVLAFWDRIVGKVDDRDFDRLVAMMLATRHMPKDADKERDLLASGINELADHLIKEYLTSHQ